MVLYNHRKEHTNASRKDKPMKQYRFVIRNKRINRKVEIRYTYAENIESAEKLIWTRDDCIADWEILSREVC